MGGMAKKLPFETGLFAIGLLCLMAIPGTSGFFSKEAIIAGLWSSSTAGEALWWCAIFGALITSIYSCRLFFLVFLGKTRFTGVIESSKSKRLKAALLTLAILSLLGGFIALDFNSIFGLVESGADSMPGSLSVSLSVSLSGSLLDTGQEPTWLHTVAIATPFAGVLFSWLYFKVYRVAIPEEIKRLAEKSETNFVTSFCRRGLGFDRLYSTVIVSPFVFIARLNKRDVVDQILMGSAWYVTLWRDVIVASQNGLIRWYAAGFGLGLVVILGAWLI